MLRKLDFFSPLLGEWSEHGDPIMLVLWPRNPGMMLVRTYLARCGLNQQTKRFFLSVTRRNHQNRGNWTAYVLGFKQSEQHWHGRSSELAMGTGLLLSTFFSCPEFPPLEKVFLLILEDLYVCVWGILQSCFSSSNSVVLIALIWGIPPSSESSDIPKHHSVHCEKNICLSIKLAYKDNSLVVYIFII